MKRTLKAGFSLIEVTLAILVAGVGILSVFALFPQALQYSRESVDATVVIEFADSVFETLQMRASSTNESWSAFASDLPESHTMTLANQTIVETTVANEAEVFKIKPHWHGGDINYDMAVLTYRLQIQNTVGNAKGVRLQVWPGDIEDYVDGQPHYPGGYVFYREYIPVE
jgi:uncharacterized protein (TIGR02598 family)